MNIVILSGGSGNDALMKGLIDHGYADSIKVITNAWDNGKSTGTCRLITSTLGVSDIRKNHFRMYKYSKTNKDEGLVHFYSDRFDLGENPCEFCVEKLEQWGLSFLTSYAENFFDRPLSKVINNYKDFSIANIVYAEMYAEKGYEETNKYFCNLLGINDFVILNSFDNVFINAITEKEQYIKGEEKIVEYKKAADPISRITYSKNLFMNQSLNYAAINAIKNADVIIISTGTFWSSIYPTFDYLSFYIYVNASKAKKIWVMNTEEDKDAYGVSSNDFIRHFEKLGLDLTDFTIIENLDGKETLHEDNDNYNIVKCHIGNNNGKNDPELYYEVIKEFLNNE
jgi:2-phospho-L-lactate transferase/gluconeogenesis factor (CofD/UPF0052 family)